MQKSEKTLYLFTTEFPYGNSKEIFLETEIQYLAKSFKEVHIVPLVKKDFKRLMPDNIIVENWFADENVTLRSKINALIKNPLLTTQLLFSELTSKGLPAIFRGKKELLNYLAYEIIRSNVLVREFKNFVAPDNIILYSYWLCELPAAIIFANKKTINTVCVSRAHGFDIYDDKWIAGVPFRNWKIKNLSKIYVVSQFGIDYLKKRIPEKLHRKLALSQLGVEKHKHQPTALAKSIKTIVSCSRIVALKRLDLTIALLKELNENIEWVHFGDGIDRSLIEQAALMLPPNIQVRFAGHVDNNRLMEYFSKNHVDLFISTSESEGLPVSMMEAQSFGIPIISYPVGGVPEIVVEGKTGFFFQEKLSMDENAKVLQHALLHTFDRAKIIDFFTLNFNAENNYKAFISDILSIKKRKCKKH